MGSNADNSGRAPLIAISMGDPMGIGPEITAKALADTALLRRARFVVFGSGAALRRTSNTNLPTFWTVTDPNTFWTSGAPANFQILLVDDVEADLPDGPPGPTAAGGEASFRWVEQAIQTAQLPGDDPRNAAAIVTAPISKTSWSLAGYTQFPGHTELLADRFGAERHGMLFVGPSLRVILVTIHHPLARIPTLVTTAKVLDAIELANLACRDLGVPHPRIAVCGLNPHAGEGGVLGTEDDATIAPAVAEAARRGVNVKGPLPADTLFSAAAAQPRGRGLFDCVVAMYHDQGLIPVKLLDGMKAVNVTVGLPTIRTSPAHGTAFDIAGRGMADPESMRCAIDLAIRMCTRE